MIRDPARSGSIDREQFARLMAAESHGRYFHQHVRSAGSPIQ
ncbi:MAG: KTSC domain-containing protein [Planctomycetaceae bacterium]|nr:KTSC domain-containing protein [Planctomycetaceae bacterium]